MKKEEGSSYTKRVNSRTSRTRLVGLLMVVVLGKGEEREGVYYVLLLLCKFHDINQNKTDTNEIEQSNDLEENELLLS